MKVFSVSCQNQVHHQKLVLCGDRTHLNVNWMCRIPGCCRQNLCCVVGWRYRFPLRPTSPFPSLSLSLWCVLGYSTTVSHSVTMETGSASQSPWQCVCMRLPATGMRVAAWGLGVCAEEGMSQAANQLAILKTLGHQPDNQSWAKFFWLIFCCCTRQGCAR